MKAPSSYLRYLYVICYLLRNSSSSNHLIHPAYFSISFTVTHVAETQPSSPLGRLISPTYDSKAFKALSKTACTATALSSPLAVTNTLLMSSLHSDFPASNMPKTPDINARTIASPAPARFSLTASLPAPHPLGIPSNAKKSITR